MSRRAWPVNSVPMESVRGRHAAHVWKGEGNEADTSSWLSGAEQSQWLQFSTVCTSVIARLRASCFMPRNLVPWNEKIALTCRRGRNANE
jgi:hypothetical protein